MKGSAKRQSWKQWLKDELRLGLILFLYLWALLGLFVLNESVVNREHGFHIVFQGFAVANALVFTKVMLVLEGMDLSGWLSNRPKIFTILFEAAFCTALFLVVHCLERVIVGFFRSESTSAGMPAIGGGGVLGVFVVALILFVTLLPFFTFKIVARAIGPNRIEAILFQRPEAG